MLESSFDEGEGRFSPDGRWIAYTSDESGRDEIYLRPFVAGETPSVGPKWLVSNSGSVPGGARWRRDGKELFYRHRNGALMAADVSFEGERVRTGLPRQLFPLSLAATQWDVASDGQRFLVAVPVDPSSADPVTIVLNWPRMLRQ